MKPLHHAKSSVKKHGGHVDDYLPLHTLLDEPKGAYCNVRHRAILHNSFGPFLLERVFGYYITNSDGRQISTRQLAEEHIVEDLGFIPSIATWLRELPIKPWMDRISARKKRFKERQIND